MMSQNQFGANQKFPYGNIGKNQSDKKEGFKSEGFRNVSKESNENKLFKRSSYHVAIAYHIYLKKLQSKKTDAVKLNLDPTYHAKKLREDKNK